MSETKGEMQKRHGRQTAEAKVREREHGGGKEIRKREVENTKRYKVERKGKAGKLAGDIEGKKRT